MINWNYLNSGEVYIYPSANSNDGGDVNTEYNLSRVSDKLSYKSYVVCHKGDIVKNSQGVVTSSPFMMTIFEDNGDSYLRIKGGSASIDGYLIKIHPDNDEYLQYKIDEELFDDLDSFISASSSMYNELYYNGEKKVLTPFEISRLGYSELPRLHVVLKLLKNATGNVRGDRISDGTNRGLALSVLTDSDLGELNVPYVVIGNIYYENLDGGRWVAEDGADKYKYIDESQVLSSETGKSIEEVLTGQTNRKLNKLDELNKFYEYDNGSYEGVYSKKVSISFEENEEDSVEDLPEYDVTVTRYNEIRGVEDLDGDVVVKAEKDTNYDRTYSIDKIQKRTHPSSNSNGDLDPSESNYDEENEIANDVDSRDNGAGQISVFGDSSSSAKTINGRSRLLARADHHHDLRYIKTKAANPTSQDTQEIGTKLKVNSEVTCESLKVNGSAEVGSVSNPSSLRVHGSTTVDDLVVSGTTNFAAVSSQSAEFEQLKVRGQGVNQFRVYSGQGGYKLEVSSKSEFSQKVTVSTGGLEVSGGIKSDTINVDGTGTNIVSNLTSNGKVTVNNGGLDVNNGDLKVKSGDIEISSNDPSTGGNLKVTRKATAGSLEVTGDATVGGNLEVTGTIRGSRVYNAVYNDVAELYLKENKDEIIEPGTLISKVKGKDCYSTTRHDFRKLVVGVASDSYGQLLGGSEDLTIEENLERYVPVALCGRVRVRVAKGIRIEEGDLLSPSLLEDGVATNLSSPGYIIGKALESTDGSKDRILMQVSLM